MPFFSVVIPSRNRVELLLETLASVIAQRFTDYEVIVVNDCSTDDTESRVRALGGPIEVITQSQQGGVSRARNRGIEAARGEYVAFLDDDDLWPVWALETYANVIASLGRPAFITSNGCSFSDRATIDEMTRGPDDFRVLPDYLAYASGADQPGWLLPTGVVVRNDVLKSVGGFDPEFAYFEDEDLWLRLGVEAGFVRIASPLCWGYRSHAQAVSAKLEPRFQNMQKLLAKEARGDYPGGETRRQERLHIVTALARHLARRGAREGFAREAWRLYCTLLGGNLEQRRFVFLAGLPLELVASETRRRLTGARKASMPAPTS